MKRGAAPAFQFYARELYSQTARLSLAAAGAYFRLLAWSWDNGPLPPNVQTIARLCNENDRVFARVWREISHLWNKTPRGFASPYLNAERRKQRIFRRKQRKAGQASAAKRNINHGSTTVQPRFNQNPTLRSSDCGLDQDQEQTQDQEQRAPHTGADYRRQAKNETRPLRTPNPRALFRLVESTIREMPIAGIGELAEEIKTRSARAGIECAPPDLQRAIDSALHRHAKGTH